MPGLNDSAGRENFARHQRMPFAISQRVSCFAHNANHGGHARLD